MKELTRAEEEIMQILWQLQGGFVKEVIEKLPEPKPAYNTVSTIVRILEQKGFVDHEPHGKSFRYFPIVSKSEYSKQFMKGFVGRFFSGSYQQMVSFFANHDDMSMQEIEEVLAQLKQNQQNENTH
jgi:BlaI family penicillinase repressor